MTPDEKTLFLESRLHSVGSDQEKADILNELSYNLRSRDMDRAESLAEEALQLSLRILHRYGIASAYRNKGVFEYNRGNFSDALKHLAEASNWFQKIQDVRGHASVLSNKGLVYWKMGEHGKAMEAYMSALEINLQMNDKFGECATLINIGGLYQTMGNSDEAKEFYEQALVIAESNKLYIEWGTVLSNIGTIHFFNGDRKTALAFFLKSLQVREATNQEREISVSLLNIGASYASLGEFEKGLVYMEQSLDRRKAMGDKNGEAQVLKTIGECSFEVGQYNKAIEYCERAVNLAESLKAKPLATSALKLLSDCYKAIGNFEKSIELFARFHDLDKEIIVEQSEEKTRKLMVKYEVDKSMKEAELYRIKNEDLAKLNSELHEANTLKSELLGIAAHDLKNPLQTIMGFADLIREESKGIPDIEKKAATIRKASQKMLGLIQDLLQTAAIDAGKLDLNKRITDIGLLVQLVSENLYMMAEQKSQKLNVEAELDCMANVDPERIKEVIENLISNAIKYSDKEKSITVRVFKHDNAFVNITVQDEGDGFSEEDLKKIFGKFQRLSSRPTGGESSTGLGLSIVKKLVELHQGKVIVESEGKKKGSLFKVILPVSNDG